MATQEIAQGLSPPPPKETVIHLSLITVSIVCSKHLVSHTAYSAQRGIDLGLAYSTTPLSISLFAWLWGQRGRWTPMGTRCPSSPSTIFKRKVTSNLVTAPTLISGWLADHQFALTCQRHGQMEPRRTVPTLPLVQQLCGHPSTPLGLAQSPGRHRHRSETNSQFGWMQTRSRRERSGRKLDQKTMSGSKSQLPWMPSRTRQFVFFTRRLYHTSVMTKAFRMDGFRFICFTDL